MRRGERIPRDVADEVARLYVEERLTLAEIAERLPVSKSGAGKLLQRLGVPKRHRGGGGERPHTRIPPELEREAVRLYAEEYLSLRQVAARLPMSAMAVRNALRRSRVRVRPRSWGNRDRHLPHRAIEDVVEAIEGGQTARQAAETLGITVGAVYARMRTAGLRGRTRPRVTPERVAHARRLVAEGTVDSAARELGVTRQTVRNYLRR